MHFHLTRREILNQVVERYGFQRSEADAIVDALEDTGEIEFSGAIFSVRNPTDQDAKALESIAFGALGKGSAGAIGHYKVKEFLQFILRQAAARPKKRASA